MSVKSLQWKIASSRPYLPIFCCSKYILCYLLYLEALSSIWNPRTPHSMVVKHPLNSTVSVFSSYLNGIIQQTSVIQKKSSKISNMLGFKIEGLLALHRAPFLVGCSRLLIPYILFHPPYLENLTSICNLRTRHSAVARDPLKFRDSDAFISSKLKERDSEWVSNLLLAYLHKTERLIIFDFFCHSMRYNDILNSERVRMQGGKFPANIYYPIYNKDKQGFPPDFIP
jgi:hypothetical protein